MTFAAPPPPTSLSRLDVLAPLRTPPVKRAHFEKRRDRARSAKGLHTLPPGRRSRKRADSKPAAVRSSRATLAKCFRDPPPASGGPRIPQKGHASTSFEGLVPLQGGAAPATRGSLRVKHPYGKSFFAPETSAFVARARLVLCARTWRPREGGKDPFLRRPAIGFGHKGLATGG